MYVDDDIKDYAQIRDKLTLVHRALAFLFCILMAYSFAIPLRDLVTVFTENSIIVVTIYTFFVYIFYFIFTLGITFYKDFHIKQKFEISNQTIVDWAKSLSKKELWTYSAFFFSSQLLYLFLEMSPKWWWAWSAISWIIYDVVICKIYPEYLAPLLTKYPELEDKDMKRRLFSLAKSVDIKIKDICYAPETEEYQIKSLVIVDPAIKQRIILSEKLAEYSPEEIEIIVGRKLAQHYFGHIWKSVLTRALMVMISFIAIGFIFDFIARALGIMPISSIASLPLLLVLISFFMTIGNSIYNMFNRELEQEADSFTMQVTKSPEAFVSVMIRKAQAELIDPNPSRFIEILLFDLPSIEKRIHTAEDYAQELFFAQRKPPEIIF